MHMVFMGVKKYFIGVLLNGNERQSVITLDLSPNQYVLLLAAVPARYCVKKLLGQS